MNSVLLIGNLTRDPELTETASGVKLCKFAIAVNRAYTSGDGEKQTDFFNVTAWRGLAENVAKYCKKGNKVCVQGEIQMRQYEGNDGVKRTAVDVIARDVEFLSPKAKQEEDDFPTFPTETQPQAQPQAQPKRSVQQRLQSFDIGDDEEIPF